MLIAGAAGLPAEQRSHLVDACSDALLQQHPKPWHAAQEPPAKVSMEACGIRLHLLSIAAFAA